MCLCLCTCLECVEKKRKKENHCLALQGSLFALEHGGVAVKNGLGRRERAREKRGESEFFSPSRSRSAVSAAPIHAVTAELSVAGRENLPASLPASLPTKKKKRTHSSTSPSQRNQLQGQLKAGRVVLCLSKSKKEDYFLEINKKVQKK